MAPAVTYMLSVFNVADLNSRCGKRNCACGTLVRDFQMGLLLATVIPTESLSLSVVLSYRCRSVFEFCKNRKGNDNIWRYTVAIIASCATITQPLASCLKRLYLFIFLCRVMYYRGAELFLQKFRQLERLLNSSHNSQVFWKELFCTWGLCGCLLCLSLDRGICRHANGTENYTV